jgi:hypothetical protein
MKCTYSNVYQYFISLSKNTTKIVFWPDLVPAIYAKDTLVQLEELKIEYVPKEENPLNVPQIWPIENFWANLKRNNYCPKDVKCLMTKIRKQLKSIETKRIRKAMKEVPAKARKTHRLGLIYFCK